MNATQFDGLIRRLGESPSRRAVLSGLLGAAMLPVSRTLGAQPATPVAVEDQPADTSDADASNSQLSGAQGICADFVWCKASQMNMRDGTVTTLPVGRIPGGPYETQWCWDCYHLTSDSTIPGCVPIGHDISELVSLCNNAYPDQCQGDCCAGALFDVFC